MMVKKTEAQLTSIEHGRFDTAALQQELAQSLEDDRLYKLTDNAKKRAIHTAANYDEFKNLVACADLKPISQKELRDFSHAERQTNISYKKKPRTRRTKTAQLQSAAPSLDAPPHTAAEFCRNWKHHLPNTEDKLSYLHVTTSERLGTIFKTDMDADLLAEIAHVLVASWREDESTDSNPEEPAQATFALQTMQTLAQTNRFALTLDFLDNHQLDKVHKLVQLLDGAGVASEHQETLNSLKAKFRVA